MDSWGACRDWLVVPVGGGATIFGIWRGFRDLLETGRTNRMPRLVAVQPTRFNTLEIALARGLRSAAELAPIAMDEAVDTILRNLKHGVPPDAVDALRAIRESGGFATSVTDEAAGRAQGRVGREEGLFCEPSAAAGAAAVEALTRAGRLASVDTVVCVLTGSGLREVGGLPKVRPVPLPPDAGPEALDRVLTT